MLKQPKQIIWRLAELIVITAATCGALYWIAVTTPFTGHGLAWRGLSRVSLYAVAAGVLILILLIMHRKSLEERGIRPYWRTFFYTALCVAIPPMLILFVTERLSAALVPIVTKEAPFILPPLAREDVLTPEFAISTITNSLGFRDHEVDLSAKKAYRILAIGDQFTYGWGVQLEQSWPKVLERELADQGRTVEVLNLGCPGGGTDCYVEIAAWAIPLLKPDLVIVAVVEGVDVKLANLGATTSRLYQHRLSAERVARQSPLGRSMPHFEELLHRNEKSGSSFTSAEQHRRGWQHTASRSMLIRIRSDQSLLDGVDEETKMLFLQGGLRPAEVLMALAMPDYLAFTLNLDDQKVLTAIARVGADLAQIKQLAADHACQCMVLDVTPSWYVNEEALRHKKRAGYHLEASVLNDDAPERAIQMACDQAGVPRFSSRAAFGKQLRQGKYSFEFDSSCNAAGHALYGGELGKYLAQHWKD